MANRKNRKSTSPRAESSHAPEIDAVQNPPKELSKPWVYAALLLVVLFAAITLFELGSRSLHIDEVATINEGARRTGDSEYQKQHAWFLDAYYWYGQGKASLTALRAPSLLASLIGIGVLAFLSWKVRDSQALFFAVFLTLCIPLFWQFSARMRFYGFLFLFGAGSLWALWEVCKGWIVVPLIANGMLSVIAYKFHPAALPWHGFVFLATLAVAMYMTWSEWKSPGQLSEFWEKRRNVVMKSRLACLALTCLALIFGCIRFGPGAIKMAGELRTRRGNTSDELLESGRSVTDIVAHASEWIGEGAFAWIHWIAVAVFVVFISIGVASQFRSKAKLFSCLAISALFIHYILAYVLGSSAVFSIKYLTSSLPTLLLFSAVGTSALLAFLASLMPQRVFAIASVFVLLLPIVIVGSSDISSRLSGDATNALTIGTVIQDQHRRSGAPNLLAPVALHEVMEFHSDLGMIKPVIRAEREAVGEASAFTLILRSPDFFKAEILKVGVDEIAGVPLEYFSSFGPFMSSSHPDFSYNLWTPNADVVLAAGMETSIAGQATALFMEPGSWIVEGKLAATPPLADDAFVIEQPTSISFSGNGKLVPDYSAPAIRHAATAQAGPINEWNRPMHFGENPGYYLAHNETVEYEFTFPSEASSLTITTQPDLPAGGAIAIGFNDDLSGIYGLQETDSTELNSLQIEIPPSLWGKVGRVWLTFVGENSARESDSEEVRALKLLNLTLEAGPLDGYTPNGMGSIPLTAEGMGIPVGEYAFDNANAASQWNTSITKDLPVIFSVEDQKLKMKLPSVTTSHIAFSSPVPIRPGTYITPETETRAINTGEASIVSGVIFLDESGAQLSQALLSQLPIDEGIYSDWARRFTVVEVPEDARTAVLAFYINTPDSYQHPGEGWFEVRKARLVRP